MSAEFSEIPLRGLQGSSLLGFMAALGAFKTLAERFETAAMRLRWVPDASSSCATLQCPPGFTEAAALPEQLHAALFGLADHRSITIDKDLKIPGEKFRAFSQSAADEFLKNKGSIAASMAAAFGCDAVLTEDGTIQDTAFRTMSGAGHQHFLASMNDLAKETTIEQLREALFGPWRYRDPSPIMRWDSEDDRRYALRWDEPSKDPVRTVRGANRLAVAALPLFPVVPLAGNAVATTGFSGRGSRDTFVTWPLWNGWLSLDAVRTLLAMPGLQSPRCTTAAFSDRGIVAIQRSQRITLGKYRNFTPARSL